MCAARLLCFESRSFLNCHDGVIRATAIHKALKSVLVLHIKRRQSFIIKSVRKMKCQSYFKNHKSISWRPKQVFAPSDPEVSEAFWVIQSKMAAGCQSVGFVFPENLCYFTHLSRMKMPIVDCTACNKVACFDLPLSLGPGCRK